MKPLKPHWPDGACQFCENSYPPRDSRLLVIFRLNDNPPEGSDFFFKPKVKICRDCFSYAAGEEYLDELIDSRDCCVCGEDLSSIDTPDGLIVFPDQYCIDNNYHCFCIDCFESNAPPQLIPPRVVVIEEDLTDGPRESMG